MVDLVNNIKNKPVKYPREINNISKVTEDVLKKMLVVDPSKRIEWKALFAHEILKFNDDQLKK